MSIYSNNAYTMNAPLTHYFVFKDWNTGEELSVEVVFQQGTKDAKVAYLCESDWDYYSSNFYEEINVYNEEGEDVTERFTWKELCEIVEEELETLEMVDDRY